jgi:hypothetical protein
VSPPEDSETLGPTPRAFAKTDPTKGKITSDGRAQTLLDGDHVDAIEKLWQEVTDLWRHRRVDVELRTDILRVAAKVSPELVDQLERELDVATPAAVLEAHPELIEDRPALGAFPSAEHLDGAPSVEDWYVADPRRLRAYVLEAYRFGSDEKVVVQSVLEFAYKLGIDLALAKDIVTHALIDARAHHDEAVAR